jgi:hypothetical protein
MHRVIALAVAGATLAGCSSFSLDAFKPTPPTVQLQLDSVPPGADAKTSLGPGCKTPCSVAVTVPESAFSVSYTLDKFQPATVQVQVIHHPGDLSTSASTSFDPSPAIAELRPVGPPPKAARKKGLRPKKPQPAKGTAEAPADSAFPSPVQASAPAAPGR